MSILSISDKELIHKFLNESLSQEEEELFIKRKGDDVFLSQIEEAVISQAGRQQLKQKLKNIAASQNEDIPIKGIYTIYKILVGTAAVIAIILGLNIFLNGAVNSEQLFVTYYEPYPNIYAVKGDNRRERTSLDIAFQLYDAEQYEKAVSAFAKVEKDFVTNTTLFYYGQSLLAYGETQAAKEEFKKITLEYPLYNESQWYLGLIYIKQDSLKNVKDIYTRLMPRVGVVKREKIKQLLRDIE